MIPPTMPLASECVITQMNHCGLLTHTPAGELVTRAQGNVKDAIGRATESGQLAAVDPDCRMIGLFLYDGMLKVSSRWACHCCGW